MRKNEEIENFKLLTKNERLGFIRISLISWMNGFVQLFASYIFIPFVSYFIDGTTPIIFSVELPISNSMWFIFVIVLIQVGSITLNVISSTSRNRYLQLLVKRISTNILTFQLNKNFEVLNNQNSGEESKKILSDSNQIGMFHFGSYLDFVIGSLNFIIFTFFLAYVNSLFMIVFMVYLTLIILLSLLFVKLKIYKIGKNLNRINQARYNQINEILNNTKLIKMYQVRNHFIQKYDQASNEFLEFITKSFYMSEIPKGFIEFGSILFIISILVVSKWFIIDSKNLFPQLSFLLLALYRLLPSFYKLSQSLHNIYLTKPILLNNIDSFLIDNENPETGSTIDFLASIRGENISYSYENQDRNVINNINFNIRSGTINGVFGESGSGKTTLISIILSLYKPSLGQIYLDNVPISSLDKEKYRELFAYVAQETYLFNESIMFNITLEENNTKLDLVKLNKVIDLVDLHEFINNSENGLNSIIGERGIKISGGQRQRIGLARAFYRDSKIIVLDEATNALDIDSENLLLEKFRKLLPTKTFVLVSHRENTRSYCDDTLEIHTESNFID